MGCPTWLSGGGGSSAGETTMKGEILRLKFIFLSENVEIISTSGLHACLKVDTRVKLKEKVTDALNRWMHAVVFVSGEL